MVNISPSMNSVILARSVFINLSHVPHSERNFEEDILKGGWNFYIGSCCLSLSFLFHEVTQVRRVSSRRTRRSDMV